VTGGTGFTGPFVVRELLASGYQISCLVRTRSDRSQLPTGMRFLDGDFDQPESLMTAFRGHQILVNVASLGFGHATAIVQAALHAKMERAIFFSSTSIFTSLQPESLQTRLEAEEIIRSSGLASTILRPTMIYGGPGDRNISRLVRYLRRWRVLLIPGRKGALQQPVLADDLAAAVVSCLASPSTEGKCYELAGGSRLTMKNMVQLIGRLLGIRVLALLVPAQPWVNLLQLMEKWGAKCPISAEQILRLSEDKVFDNTPASRDFGYQPRVFEEGVRLLLSRLRS